MVVVRTAGHQPRQQTDHPSRIDPLSASIDHLLSPRRALENIIHRAGYVALTAVQSFRVTRAHFRHRSWSRMA